jgi:glycosyltransferase involved in cell wall biosynthesis/tetratricopeptide (TPR) repeat protein
VRLYKIPKFIVGKIFDSRASGPVEADTIDFDFYYNYYSDLYHLRSKSALEDHYVKYGRPEGRFRNFAEAKESLEKQFGALPSDFSADFYKMLNADLAPRFRYDWQFLLHYLQLGRREGRPYKGALATRQAPWLAMFRLPDFVACTNYQSRPAPLTIEAGRREFEAWGIDSLAPLQVDAIFDPAFYRTEYRVEQSQSDVDLYRHWLTQGLLEGKAANEAQCVSGFIHGGQYPECFQWSKYIEKYGHESALRTRLEALRHFFEQGLDDSANTFVSGPGSDELFYALGLYHLVRGHLGLSISAFGRAIGAGLQDARVYHHRGDAYRQSGEIINAQSDYARAMARPNAPVWSYIHAARIAANDGDFSRAFHILRDGHSIWFKAGEFRTAINDIIEMFFVAHSNLARENYSSYQRNIGDYIVNSMLSEISCQLSALDVMPLPLPLDRLEKNETVVMLANQGIRQCTHYRVEQKARQLASADIPVEIFDQENVAEFIASLLHARAAIFYRTAANPAIIRAIMIANALGVPTYYDLDDLIFDTKYPDTFESYGGQISRPEYTGLLYGVPVFRYAMSLCEYGIASTAPLAAAMASVVRSGTCDVLRNGLDERNERSILLGSGERIDGDVVTIFYGSGTKAHNSDFNTYFGPALASAFRNHNVRLVVAGHLTLDPEIEACASQITRFEFISDVEQYWAILSACDINIAVLAPNEISDCKSEIKWLEAAVLKVPSIVTGTKNYRDVLIDGVDALIVESAEEWEIALDRLIRDRGLRRGIGEMARRKALNLYSLKKGANYFSRILERNFDATIRRRADAARTKNEASAGARLKVLICNVFFPPQTYGGATRVVRDNVDYIQQRCPDIDVSVFATDNGENVPGRLRFDKYGEVPVFRLSTPQEVNMDWRPFNKDNEETFSRIVASVQPDLIHFHCIQRLSASIVHIAIERRIPYIVTVHDGWWLSDNQFFVDSEGLPCFRAEDPFVASPPPGVSLPESVARRRRLMGLLAKAAKVIAVSESFAGIYRAAGCPNVVAIPNGVSPLRKIARRDPREGRLSLGHVGGRTVHKGARLIEGVLRTNQFDNLSLTMVDMTMEKGARVRTMWGNTPVLLQGPCPQDEVPALYGSLDVLLAPSIWPESFGLVTREAKALGLWVVASNRGAVAEGIQHDVNGFVIDVSDNRELISVLRTLDGDVARFKSEPPSDGAVMRTASDQGRDVVELYREVLTSGSKLDPAGRANSPSEISRTSSAIAASA